MVTTEYHTTFAGIDNRGPQVVHNSGSIETHHHYPEHAETPPSPALLIPFARDDDFICRGSILAQIHDKCAAPGARIALVGLGGVGKSQLAIEFAYQLQDRSPGTWIFWIHASNAARFEQSYRDIADEAKILGRRDPKANVFKLVHDWLRAGKRAWILILDNLDDGEFLYRNTSGWSDQLDGEYSRPLQDYIPQSLNGRVLITSRSMGAVSRLVERKGVIDVGPMSESDAKSLLEKKLGHQNAEGDLRKLAAVLEFMPLAIIQAAAYISHRAPRSSVSLYLEEFQKSDRRKTSLLNYEGGQIRRDAEAKNSIITTWQISFDHIRRAAPSAADLLSLMSFFDREGIPEILLRSEQDRSRKADRTDEDLDHEDNDSASEMEDTFEESILTLRNYSLVSVGSDKMTFEMHSLVQLATRKWLEATEQLDKWKQRFISNLCAVLPTGEFENWANCQALFPHAKSAVTQRPEEQSSLIEWAAILYRASWYAWRRGNHIDAVMMAEKSMKVGQQIYSKDEKHLVNNIELLGLIYVSQGRWQEAEKLQVQVLETRKKVLGKEHPETLNSMANLAGTYDNQGRWREAIELQAEASEMYQTVFEAKHPNVLTSMDNLALMFSNHGRWKEAEGLQVQVLEARMSMLGSEHPDTLISMNNLAITYEKQGQWEEAEKLEERLLEVCKRVLGARHPQTLISMANLASTYGSRGRWKDAEELEVQALEASREVLGAEHPDTLTSMGNLALTYREQGRWTEAEALQVRVLEMRDKVLGAEHPNTLISMNNLASIYSKQGQWNKAEQLGQQVLDACNRVLGAGHPQTLNSMSNLASTLNNQGRWKEAEEIEVQVLETRKRVFGAEHPSTLASMNNLAWTYSKQGQWKEAEELQVQGLEICKKVLGAEHPVTLISMSNLAPTYWNQGREKQAEELEVQVLETRRRVLGVHHPSTLISMSNLASTYSSQGRWKEAEDLEQQVLEVSKKVLGERHPSTLASMANLASTYSCQGRWEEAVELKEEAVRMYKVVLGMEHPDTLTSMAGLAHLWKARGRSDEAVDLMRDCVQLHLQALGSSHPHTISMSKELARWEDECTTS